MSNKAGNAQGAELGKQTAASSLGITAGSAAGGLLFDVTWLPNASFVLITLITVIAVLLSLGLPNLLMIQRRGKAKCGARDRRLPNASSAAATGRPAA